MLSLQLGGFKRGEGGGRTSKGEEMIGLHLFLIRPRISAERIEDPQFPPPCIFRSLRVFFVVFFSFPGLLLRVFCVLRGVGGGRLRHRPPAGVPGGAGLAVGVRQQDQRALQRLPVAAFGESPRS